MARFALLHLKGENIDPRSWRPHILVFTADLNRTLSLVQLCVAFGQERGIVTVVTLKVGDVEDVDDFNALLKHNEEILASRGITAFVEVAAVPRLAGGVVAVAQSNGFAGLQSNTVAFGWSETGATGLAALLQLVRKLERLEKCSIICRNPPVEKRNGVLVVWWKGKENNGDLMLLFAHLLTRASGWEGSRIVLRSIVGSEEEVAERSNEFKTMLEEIRINGSVEVFAKVPELSIPQMITKHSQDAAIVFLGLSVPEPDEEMALAEQLIDLTDGLPGCVLVRNSGPYRGKLV